MSSAPSEPSQAHLPRASPRSRPRQRPRVQLVLLCMVDYPVAFTVLDVQYLTLADLIKNLWSLIMSSMSQPCDAPRPGFACTVLHSLYELPAYDQQQTCRMPCHHGDFISPGSRRPLLYTRSSRPTTTPSTEYVLLSEIQAQRSTRSAQDVLFPW